MTLARLSIGVLLISVAACSVNPTQFIGPNGKAAYSMKCSGMGRDWSDCYVEAGKLCPAGYKIIDQATGTIAVPYQGSIIVAPKQTLVVECT